MAEPTDEQLREYASKLPKIYKYILEAFAKAIPDRRAGEGLRVSHIVQWVTLQDDYFRPKEVDVALRQLEKLAFVIVNRKKAEYTPTEIGERIIEIISGISPPNPVPDLPVPAWV